MLSAPRCLRQRLARSCRTSAFSTYVRLAESSSPSGRPPPHDSAEATTKSGSDRRSSVKRAGLSNISAEVRKDDLAQAGFKDYPRMDGDPWTLSRFKSHYVDENGTDRIKELEDTERTVIGRVSSIRSAGKTLAFVDIAEQAQPQKLQVILSEARLSAHRTEHQPVTAVREFIREIRRGDVISVTGSPCRTKTNEFSISASQMPRLLSPCLHPIPDRTTSDNADIAMERHAQHLANPAMLQDLYQRSVITTEMTKYLTSHDFVAVQTPILAASAGGASARPFTTVASEFPDRQLALRIAPELWLKRLMVGGMQKVFEIGPSFRNEGLDASHNPEFTTCEFYSIDWNLDRMMFHTQNMFNAISHKVNNLHPSWIEACGDWPQPPWPTIDFIPALNAALGPELELPNLSAPEAREQILAIFGRKGIPIPATPTLPRLLDHLCAYYLEPQCETATWIVNTPECLSPLAKSFPHPDLPHQQVAARAELFIRQKEVVNCYEEENSPGEQKRKFLDQQRHSRIPAGDASVDKFDDEAMPIDHDYIRALEWGLPPIGGWGCGIDRLVMLMLGKDNIRDVLSFGNLRMVTRGAEKATKAQSDGFVDKGGHADVCRSTGT